MSSPGSPESLSQDQLSEVLAEYMERLDRGEPVDRERLLREHPAIAGELRAYFETCDDISLLARSSPGEAADCTSQVDPNQTLLTSDTSLGASSPHAEGTRRLFDYELLERLGHGGMGVVFKARQISLNRLVALKVIRAGELASPADRQRFRSEAEAAAGLDHPNIVPIYEVGEHAGQYFFSMKLIEGSSLAEHVSRWAEDPRGAARLVAEIARAVHHAHQHGILHRDLKPANILLAGVRDQGSGVREDQGSTTASLTPDSRPLTPVPYVTDFGLAKRFAEDAGLTQTGSIVGTPSYMAPEQASGRSKRLTTAVDVYGLGAILYELLTGRRPFQGESALETLQQVQLREPVPPRRLSAKVPYDLEVICLKALEKEPHRRYSTAEALADDLQRYLENQPIQARPVNAWERLVKWVKREPMRAALVGVCVGATLLLAGFGIWSYVQIRDSAAKAERRAAQARAAADAMTEVAEELLEREPYMDASQRRFLGQVRDWYEEFARDDRPDPAIRRKAALASFRVAQVSRELKEVPQAQTAFGRAIELQESLRREFPENLDYRQDLANSFNWLGELHREQGRRLDEAEQCYHRSQELQEGLVEAAPDVPVYHLDLARSLFNLGIVCKDTARAQDAEAHFDRAINSLRILQVPETLLARYRQELGRCYLNRGNLLWENPQRRPQARADYEAAMDVFQKLTEQVPSKPRYRYELAVAYNNRGNLLAGDSSKESQEAAEEDFGQAIRPLRGLVEGHPGRLVFRYELANVLNSWASLLAKTNRADLARATWQEARDHFAQLVKADPDVPDFVVGLARVDGNRGWLCLKLEDYSQAREILKDSLSRLRRLAEAHPNNPGYQEAFRNQYLDLASTLIALRAHRETAKHAAELPGTLGQKSHDYFLASRLLARCILLLDEDANLDETERKTLAQRYADQSLDMLRAAVARGFNDAHRIDQEKDFLPLRNQRPKEFAEILRKATPQANPP